MKLIFIKKISVLNATFFANEAWQKVSHTRIANCFRRSLSGKNVLNDKNLLVSENFD